MFITRKKFNEEIAKAVKVKEERIWREQRIDRMEQDFNERIDRLQKRISVLEEKEEVRECGETCSPVRG